MFRLLICVVCTLGLVDTVQGEEDLAKLAVIACGNNLQAFKSYETTYSITKAAAKSIPDAIAGKLDSKDVSRFKLCVTGNYDYRKSLDAPSTESAKQPFDTKKQETNVQLRGPDGIDYIADGEAEAVYIPRLQAINLSKKENWLGPGVTPLGICGVGHRGQDSLARRLSSGKNTHRVLGASIYEGKPVIGVAFSAVGRDETMEYYFDPSHGYLPIRILTYYGTKLKVEVLITDVRPCSKDRWLPYRTISIVHLDKGTGCGVTEVLVEEFEIDKEPDKKTFILKAPANTQVLNRSDAKKWFRLKQTEEIPVESLQELSAMIEKAPSNPLMDTAIPQPHSKAWRRTGWIGGGLGLLGLVLLVRRRLRSVQKCDVP